MSNVGSPFLKRINSLEEKFDRSRYPFNIPAFDDGINIALDARVTMLVGESGSGKSTLLEGESDLQTYGGQSLHKQSHGESFLAIFENRFEQGFYILDEPEAALSPQRQLTFINIIYQLEASGHAQFLIATHSPILLSYPSVKVISFNDGEIKPIDYKESNHYQLTKSFLDAPERYFHWLFEDDGA